MEWRHAWPSPRFLLGRRVESPSYLLPLLSPFHENRLACPLACLPVCFGCVSLDSPNPSHSYSHTYSACSRWDPKDRFECTFYSSIKECRNRWNLGDLFLHEITVVCIVRVVVLASIYTLVARPRLMVSMHAGLRRTGMFLLVFIWFLSWMYS